jgi:hypothetical protein
VLGEIAREGPHLLLLRGELEVHDFALPADTVTAFLVFVRLACGCASHCHICSGET